MLFILIGIVLWFSKLNPCPIHRQLCLFLLYGYNLSLALSNVCFKGECLDKEVCPPFVTPGPKLALNAPAYYVPPLPSLPFAK